jgi:hypothetical protein
MTQFDRSFVGLVSQRGPNCVNFSKLATSPTFLPSHYATYPRHEN